MLNVGMTRDKNQNSSSFSGDAFLCWVAANTEPRERAEQADCENTIILSVQQHSFIERNLVYSVRSPACA